MLYPQQNAIRQMLPLSGLWGFQPDPDEIGERDRWFDALPDQRMIAVPGSWNDQFADLFNYLGAAWYRKDVYVPRAWKDQRVVLRVGSANYAADVWLNGEHIGRHEGGHLPFEFHITSLIDWDQPNRIAIRVENKLTPTRVPPGNLPPSGAAAALAGYPNSNYDFFPYAGLHRPVMLYAVPPHHIRDVTVQTRIVGGTSMVDVGISTSQTHTGGVVRLTGMGRSIEAAFESRDHLAHATLTIPNARLWSPDDPFLYRMDVEITKRRDVIDRYTLGVGIRTVEVSGDHLLLNGQPITLRGFGRHEDFFVSGRGQNLPLMVKDYELMKWVGANSFRTSHYPYSEEDMLMADRLGFLVIDETPAVGLFFEDGAENIAARLDQAMRQTQELIARDKNHPSVILWSIANEPTAPRMFERLIGSVDEPIPEAATHTLQTLIDLAHQLDPTRPATFAGVMGGPVEWLALGDVVCINRYWGWYVQAGQPDVGAQMLDQELDSLYEALGKPILISEFGADTVAGLHHTPPVMWSEEYQVEFLRGYLDAADRKPFVIGMHIWNFADFQAVQSVLRVGGVNLKGVFTRDRKPKLAAHFLRARWTGAPTAFAPPERAAIAEPMVHVPAPTSIPQHHAIDLDDAPFDAIFAAAAARLDGLHPDANQRLRFDLGDEGSYDVIFEAGRTRVSRDGSQRADAVVKIKPNDARKVLQGKLKPVVALMLGKVKVEGDLKALGVLQSLAE